MEIEIQLKNQSPQQPQQPEKNDKISHKTLEQPEIFFLNLFRFATTVDKILIAIGSLFSVLMGSALPIFANITGKMIDSFAVNIDRYEDAKNNLFYFIYLGLGSLLVGTVMYATWSIAGQRQALACRKQYFKSLLRQEIGWFDVQKQAEITSNFAHDTLSFQQAIGEKISTLIMLFSMLCVGVGISLYNGWILSLVILGYLPVFILTWAKYIAIKHSVFKERSQIFLQSDRKAQESLGAIKLIKQMAAEEFEADIQRSILQKIKEKYRESSSTFACSTYLAIMILYLGFALTFWYGSQCIFDTSKCPSSLNSSPYTAGTIIKIFYALFLPAISMNQLSPSIQKIVEGKAAANRIFSIIDRQPLIKSKQNSLKPDSFQGIFQFVNVTFAYPKNKETKIFNGLNFTIDCTHAGIVGKSGRGKSTILQLIMRFYDPDEGAIYLDGNDLRDLDLDWLRSNIGYVGQEPILFATSIRQNLLLAKPDASDEEINQALLKAEAYLFVNNLPSKLQTYVGSEGSQLSGGQKQRIAIARALIKKPKLLLLDEATSALDRTNEKQILSTLKRVKKQFLTISITHRKKVLLNCDKVYEIKQNSQIKYTKLLSEPSDKNLTQPINEQLNTPKGLTELTISCFLQTSKVAPSVKTEEKMESERPLKSKQQANAASLEQSESKLSFLVPFLLESKCQLLISALFAIFDGLVFPVTGVILAKLLTNLLMYPLDKAHYQQQVHKLCYLLLGIAFIGPIMNTMAVFFGALLGQNIVRKLRSDLFSKLLRLPISWYQQEQNQSEKIVNKLTTSCKTMHSFLSLEIPILLIIIVNVIVGVIGAIAFEWRTGLTSIGLIPLIILSQAIQFGFIQGFAQFKGKIFQSSSQIVSESILNIRTVLLLGNPTSVEDRYFLMIDQIFNLLAKKSILSGFMYGVSNLFQFLTFGLVFFFATIFVVNCGVSIDNSIIAVFLILFACMSAGNKINLLQDLQFVKEASRWIFSLLELKDQHQLLQDYGSQQLTTPIKGNIQFKHVSFKYQNRQDYALQNFSIKINQGEQIAIVGASGCGKSTVLGLLLGFYHPNEGQIFVEGQNLKDYDLQHLRRSLRIVNQEPVLFNETIQWNIRYNSLEAANEAVRNAAKIANFNPNTQVWDAGKKIINEQKSTLQVSDCFLGENSRDQIKQQADGFKRKVGPKGSHVSGGQKQRIAIARAALRKPNVLLLDEATSALDPQNEIKVQDSLSRLMQGKTCINITHRLERIGERERIYMIKKGKVIQEGTLQELRQAQGEFFRMLQGIRQSKEIAS